MTYSLPFAYPKSGGGGALDNDAKTTPGLNSQQQQSLCCRAVSVLRVSIEVDSGALCASRLSAATVQSLVVLPSLVHVLAALETAAGENRRQSQTEHRSARLPCGVESA